MIVKIYRYPREDSIIAVEFLLIVQHESFDLEVSLKFLVECERKRKVDQP